MPNREFSKSFRKIRTSRVRRRHSLGAGKARHLRLSPRKCPRLWGRTLVAPNIVLYHQNGESYHPSIFLFTPLHAAVPSRNRKAPVDGGSVLLFLSPHLPVPYSFSVTGCRRQLERPHLHLHRTDQPSQNVFKYGTFDRLHAGTVCRCCDCPDTHSGKHSNSVRGSGDGCH